MAEHVVNIGSVTITRVEESLTPVSAENLLLGGTMEELVRHTGHLASYVDDEGNALLSIQALLVQDGDTKVVVDTCVGPTAPEAFAGVITAGSGFIEELAAAGFGREDVDYVICTHLHFDHVGWNTIWEDGELVPTFPNARYLTNEVEWEAFVAATAAAEEGQVNFFGLRDSVQPLVDRGLVDFVEPGHAVTDHLWLEATPGHSPGHVAVRIDCDGEHAMITGDLTHHPIQWAMPDWSALADSDHGESAATRRRLLEEHADTELVVIGTHYPPPVAGTLHRTATGFEFRPAPTT